MRMAGIAAAAAVTLGLAALPAQASTVDEVRARGHLLCGMPNSVPGLSQVDGSRGWKGLDADLCRALAAAVLNSADKVEYVSLPEDERVASLLRGDIDVLAHIAWTLTRDSAPGLNFAAVTYHDGQGFLVRRKFGIASALELSQASICVEKGETRIADIGDFFKRRQMPVEVLSFDTAAEAIRAYEAERCGVLSANALHLHALRLTLAQPEAHLVLPEIVSKEPLGPAVRQDDGVWFDLVRWTVYVMIDAEELGVTSGNVDDMRASANPRIRRLLGVDGDIGRHVGLDKEWAYRVVKQVGNYGEVYERNLGQGSALKIARGYNALWRQGGILYAPPVR